MWEGKKVRLLILLRIRFFTYRTIEGENIYVYALKEGYAITNFDANFDDRGYNAKSGYEYSLMISL